MWVMALQRFVLLCLTCLFVSVLAFLLPHINGGDPVRTILLSRGGDIAVDPAALEALRIHLGLDRPLVMQYGVWLLDVLQGDLGNSFVSHSSVGGELVRALGVSITLALSALGIALIAAIPAGTFSALKPGRAFDNWITFITQTAIAVPEYWLAPMVILIFALHLHILPSAGWEGPSSVVLPAMVLSLRPFAYFTRMTRAAMMDVLQAPYITAALSRGLSMRQTVFRHGARNGAMPVVTLFALWLAGLLGGSVVVEVIFSIPGMGRLIYQAVVNNDVPVLQGAFVCTVALSVLINTVADVLYILLNPTVRHGH
jgi:peptide/nickel transport system permease protein